MPLFEWPFMKKSDQQDRIITMIKGEYYKIAKTTAADPLGLGK